MQKQLGTLNLTDEVKDKVEPKWTHFNNTQQIQIHYAAKRRETEEYDQVLEKTAQEREAAGDYDGVLDVYDARLGSGLWSTEQYRHNLGTMEVRHQERMVEEATERNLMGTYRHLQTARENGKSDLFEWMGKEQIGAQLEKLEPLVQNFQADQRYEMNQRIVRGEVRSVEKLKELSGDLYTTEELAEFEPAIAARPQYNAEVMSRLRTKVAQYGVGEDRDGSAYKALSMQIMTEASREKRGVLLEELYAKQVQRREGKLLTPAQRLKTVLYNEADIYAQQGKLDFKALEGIKDNIDHMIPKEVTLTTLRDMRGWLREEVDAAVLKKFHGIFPNNETAQSLDVRLAKSIGDAIDSVYSVLSPAYAQAKSTNYIQSQLLARPYTPTSLANSFATKDWHVHQIDHAGDRYNDPSYMSSISNQYQQKANGDIARQVTAAKTQLALAQPALDALEIGGTLAMGEISLVKGSMRIMPEARVMVVESRVASIGGRLPINSKYAGDTHPSGVAFTKQGFPDFSPHSVGKVEIEGLTGNIKIDSKLANEAMNYPSTPKGYTWHHVENGRSLELVPQDIHQAVRHTGGAAVIRNGGFDK